MADGKPGRRTKEQEIAAFLDEVGLDPNLLHKVKGDGAAPEAEAPPETFAEWRTEWMRLLWQRRGEMKGIALVQGLKALASLAELEEKTAPEDEAERVPLLDRLDALPAAHAAQLLEGEIARLRGELEAHSAALDTLKGNT